MVGVASKVNVFAGQREVVRDVAQHDNAGFTAGAAVHDLAVVGQVAIDGDLSDVVAGIGDPAVGCDGQIVATVGGVYIDRTLDDYVGPSGGTTPPSQVEVRVQFPPAVVE